ncbi:MAG: sigma-54 dependent transcriptional regulator [Deltaproteobacteria bacterium]|nr:sigma-54 dependent transcriptional regulator [Deltaproteobacteria bacterium]
MDDAGLELVVATPSGAVAARATLVKRITTVGSAPDADLVVAGVPPHWLSVHRDGDTATVRVLGGGARHALALGAPVAIDGLEISLGATRGLELEAVAARLAAADTPAEALRVILDAALGASGADVGAILLASGATASATQAWSVALAIGADGAPLDDAATLLSDTIVREVLAGGARVVANDVAASPYHGVASVVALGLAAAACLPLRLDGRTLGALYVGARGRSAKFGARAHADLQVLAAFTLPFLAQLRKRAPVASPDSVLGDSPAIEAVRRLIGRVGPADLSVLVSGPSGAGKEVVARALHAASPRAARPMVAINCAAVAPGLLDAELFGYRKGAFTGAAADRAGLVEAAHGGTLFLDEIGDMPLAMQAALLRVLEQREVRRLGDTEARAVDFRLIAATHRDLNAEVAAGRFREDLLFRIQEVRIDVPGLAARGADIALLALAFLRQAEAQLGLAPHELAPDARAALVAHPWPGNVRELKGAMRRAAILADGPVVRVADLQLTPSTAPAKVASDVGALGDTTRPLAEARDAFIARYVAAVLARVDGNREAAARELGIGVRTLYRYIEP